MSKKFPDWRISFLSETTCPNCGSKDVVDQEFRDGEYTGLRLQCNNCGATGREEVC